jgi:acyl-CoA thioester hydrolase
MIPLWQGSCNQWDCDEMGHMNVRLYVEKQAEGLIVFAHALGLPEAFRASAPATIIPVDQHIRFVREVLPGRPISMRGCVLEIGESDAVIYQELRHLDGSLSACLRTRVVHIDTAEGERFAWTARTRAKMEVLRGEAPPESLPRSIQPDAPGLPYTDITLAQAMAAGAPRIGLAAVPPSHCGIHGWMEPSWFIGRLSDMVPNLLFDWRSRVGRKEGEKRIGGAVLEYRLRYHRLPRAGDLMVAHSSFGGVNGKTHSLVHWLLDPASGHAWASTQVVAITLDLDTRKAVPAPPEMIAELERLAPPGLGV